MKICLLRHKSHSSDSIYSVVKNTFIDLGHKLVEHSEAEVVVAIRDFSKIEKRYSDKKYILFQIEQYVGKPEQVKGFYDFKPDEIWGFDISNEREIYTPLGYHPCLKFDLEFESQLRKDIDVGFIGWQRGRREAWLAKVKNKWISLNTFDSKIRGENISRTRINLNIHFHEGSTFTEWGRITYFLTNKQFFISESFYCPIVVPQFKTVDQYDSLVDYFLKNASERKEKAIITGKIYKRNFDMRDILRNRL